MEGSLARTASEAWLEARRRYLPVIRNAVAVMTLILAVMALRAHTVKKVSICVEGSEPVTLSTVALRVETALSRAGIELFEGDVVLPALDTRVRSGDVIVVKRAFPVEITADGKRLEVRTTGATVEELLEMAGVSLGEHDRVVPGKATQVTADDAIRVIRVRYEYTTKDEVIPFTTTRRPDPNMDVGTTRVVRQGKNGMLRRKIKLTYEDGKLTSRTEVGNEVVSAAVGQIINVGTRPVPQVIRTSSGKLLQYTATKKLVATAYTPNDGSGSGITYTGVKAKKGIVAVDPKVIPLGTRLYIPGYGEALAADTGGAIRGLRIDLCYESHREAIQFGRQTVTVYILANR